MRRLLPIAALIWIAVMAATTAGAAADATNGPFKVVNKYALAGGGRWDYITVDAQARRIYMSRSTHVAVLDADSGKVVGDIPDTAGVHGVALAPDLGLGFVSAGGANKVVVFDLKSLKTVGEVKTGENPDSIFYHPATHTIFAQNGKSNSSSVIDSKTKQVIATIPLGGKPEFAAYDDAGNVFINLEDKNAIVVVDAAAKKVKATWPLTGCTAPSGLALDRSNHTLFAACDNQKLAVVNSSTGKVTQTVPIGDDCDAVAFDPATGYIFASNGDGKLTVIKKSGGGKYAVVQNLPSEPGSKTMGFDAAKHRIYLPAAKFTGDPTAHPRPAVVDGSVSVLVIGE